MTERTWVGLDSSISAFGWAVLRSTPYARPEVVDLGIWRTTSDARAQRKTDDLDRRLDELARELLELIATVKPAELYLEGLARGQNDGWLSVSALGQVRGLVLGIGRSHGFKVTSFRPSDARRWVTGQQKSTKLDAARALERLYPGTLARIGNPTSESSVALGATDALAIAHLGDTRGRVAGRITANVVKASSSGSEALDALEFD
jgi:Holliday junction resolvasome RuvABC endonuclease subunit